MHGKQLIKLMSSSVANFTIKMNHRLASSKVVQLKNDISSGDNDKDVWSSAVCAACDSLQREQLIAVPTDTIYGIAGLAQSTDAIHNIYQIKGRDTTKPISICVGDVGEVHKWGQVTISDALLRELLPGPVTVVFERTSSLNPDLNPGTSLVGIRVPDYGFVRDVSRVCAQPLALTSANRSRQPSTLSVQEFVDLWPFLDRVFDGGLLGRTAESRLGSTVVDLSRPGHYTIIRPGSACENTIQSLKTHGLQESQNH